MKIYETVLALTLVLTYLRATVRAIEAPEEVKPSKYATARIDTSSEPIRPLQGYNHTPVRPFIIATTPSSKYSPEQLQSMYKVNQYTNKPYNL